MHITSAATDSIDWRGASLMHGAMDRAVDESRSSQPAARNSPLSAAGAVALAGGRDQTLG
jgi:hypothetical protein